MPTTFSEMDLSTRARHCNVGIFTSFTANTNPVHISCSGYYGQQNYHLIKNDQQPEEVAMEMDNTVNRKRPADIPGSEEIDKKRFCLKNLSNFEAKHDEELMSSAEYEL